MPPTQPSDTDTFLPDEASNTDRDWIENQSGDSSLRFFPAFHPHFASVLTKFELASIEAMTGIFANPSMNGASPATIAKRAVNCAKALLAALAKEQV